MEIIDNGTSERTDEPRSKGGSYVPNEQLYKNLLKDAPLLKREDKILYQQVFEAARFELQPQSLIEWLSVRDIVDKRFEERRYQRLKVELLEHARKPPALKGKNDDGLALQKARQFFPDLETLTRMETNCANFRRTAQKDLSVRGALKSPSVAPD